MKRFIAAMSLLLAYSGMLEAQAPKWVSAYYAGWWQAGQLDPTEVDYAAITHIIHFSLILKPDGSFSGDGNGLTVNNIVEAVHAAHAADRKIILCIGGSNSDAGFAGSVLPAVRPNFISALVGFMTRYGYDGIDVDWEPIQSKTYYLDFIRELRQAMTQAKPDAELLTAISIGDDANLLARAEKYFDQINLMTYDMSGPWPQWVTWHNTPLYDGGYVFPSTGGPVPSTDAAVREKIKAGIPASKLGIGIEFYGYRWWGGDGTGTGGVTAPRQQWRTYPNYKSSVPYFQLMDTYSRYPVRWDDVAEAAYIGVDRPGSADDEFISFDNEQTIRSKAKYVEKEGLGGAILFELGGGYRRNLPRPYRDVLLQTVKEAFFHGPKPTEDTVQPTLSFQRPKSGSIISGETSIALEASDNVGVSELEVRMDGRDVVADIGKKPYVFALNTWKFPNGPHTLVGTAFDFFGNSRQAALTVTIKNEGARPAAPDMVVFDESLHPPFSNSSWGAVVDFSNMSNVYSGARSIKVEYLAWGAFDILSGAWGAEVPIDPADHDTLRFEAFPLSDLDGKVAFYNNYSIEIHLKGSQWNSVAIPLNFKDRFTRFYIQSNLGKSITCFFDNLRFTGGTKTGGASQ
jgi:chitinase